MLLEDVRQETGGFTQVTFNLSQGHMLVRLNNQTNSPVTVKTPDSTINPSEAGILAVGSARQVPVVENGEVKVGWRMKATIPVDHRVSDGAEATRFMQKLAEFLENPVRMLV